MVDRHAKVIRLADSKNDAAREIRLIPPADLG
jgi:hypothetical protein